MDEFITAEVIAHLRNTHAERLGTQNGSSDLSAPVTTPKQHVPVVINEQYMPLCEVVAALELC